MRYHDVTLDLYPVGFEHELRVPLGDDRSSTLQVLKIGSRVENLFCSPIHNHVRLFLPCSRRISGGSRIMSVNLQYRCPS